MLRTLQSAVVVLLALAGFCASVGTPTGRGAQAQPRSDKDQLQGVWTAVSVEASGEKTADELIGFIKNTPPGVPIAAEHDKYLDE